MPVIAKKLASRDTFNDTEYRLFRNTGVIVCAAMVTDDYGLQLAIESSTETFCGKQGEGRVYLRLKEAEAVIEHLTKMLPKLKEFEMQQMLKGENQ